MQSISEIRDFLESNAQGYALFHIMLVISLKLDLLDWDEDVRFYVASWLNEFTDENFNDLLLSEMLELEEGISWDIHSLFSDLKNIVPLEYSDGTRSMARASKYFSMWAWMLSVDTLGKSRQLATPVNWAELRNGKRFQCLVMTNMINILPPGGNPLYRHELERFFSEDVSDAFLSLYYQHLREELESYSKNPNIVMHLQYLTIFQGSKIHFLSTVLR